MDRLKEAKEKLLESCSLGIEKKEVKLGGQHCGMPIHPFVIKSEALEIEIKVGHFRSNQKNKELAILLMELAIDELVK